MRRTGDWRWFRTSVTYRMGTSTLRLRIRLLAAVVGLGCLLFFFFYFKTGNRDELDRDNSSTWEMNRSPASWGSASSSTSYNSTYPLSPSQMTENGVRYKIAVVSDLDTASKLNDSTSRWISYLKIGYITFDTATKYVAVEWEDQPIVLQSALSQEGRGMELSELVVFNGKLYAIDDRTGVVYQISRNRTIPWVILTDGDGTVDKGFKCEWATVKDQKLYIGGLGKDWTTIMGKILNHNPQWVKVISPTGEVEHQNWRHRYLALLKTAHIQYPGYMIHEAAAWSNINRQWFFLPRRASHSSYNEKDDERRGTNLLLRASENFSFINLNTVGKLNPHRGFSSFKFIPETSDTWIIALKSEEIDGKISSYLTVFTVTGEILLPEHEIGKLKYEGIEFI